MRAVQKFQRVQVCDGKRAVAVQTRSCANLAINGSLGFLTAYVALIATAIFVLQDGNHNAIDTSVAGVQIPADTRCLRATRAADYATVHLPLGTRTHVVELLLRLDEVVDGGDGAAARVFSLQGAATAQSQSVRCNTTTSICVDVAHVQLGGPRANFERVEAEFSYASSFANQLGLGGSMRLSAGFDYWLTTTHLCWATHRPDAPVPVASAPADASSGVLLSSAFSLPACAGAEAELFPGLASLELSWLALSSTFLQEHAEKTLNHRREVVECAAAESSNAYWLDCGPLGSCRTAPSVPYRRLAASSALLIQIDDAKQARVAVSSTPTLSRVPYLMSSSDATLVAVLRLLLILLAAAVSFIRSSQSATSSKEVRTVSSNCPSLPSLHTRTSTGRRFWHCGLARQWT